MLELNKIYNEDCEVWRPAAGYEDYLEVSSFGNAGNIVKCLKHQIKTAYGCKWEYVD